MTTHRLWPATDGPNAQQSDGDNYSMGVEFYVTATGCTATHLHFWCSTTLTGSDHIGGLFTAAAGGGSGTLVSGSTVTLPSPLVAGWNTVAFAAPVALTQGQRYRAVVFFTTNNGYTATGSYWSTGAGSAGITNGPLTAPNNAGAEGSDQCSFAGGVGDLTFPTSSFSAGNYWIDVTVDAPDAGVTGALAGTLPAPTGQAAGSVVATGAAVAAAPMPAAAVAGQVRASAVLAGTPPGPTSAIAGAVRAAGAVAAVTPGPTGELAGSVRASGALAAGLPSPTAGVAGSVVLPGALASGSPLPLASLTGAQGGAVGTVAATSPMPVAALAAAVTTSGQLAGVVPLPVVVLGARPGSGHMRATARAGPEMRPHQRAAPAIRAGA